MIKLPPFVVPKNTFGRKLLNQSSKFKVVQSLITLTASFRTEVVADPRRVYLSFSVSAAALASTFIWRSLGANHDGAKGEIDTFRPFILSTLDSFSLVQNGIELKQDMAAGSMILTEIFFIGG